MERIGAESALESKLKLLSPIKDLWRRGRERFIDPALMGMGVAAGILLVGVYGHFAGSAILGVSPEALRQTYVNTLPTLTTVGAVIGGFAGIIHRHTKNRSAKSVEMYGRCIGGK